MKNSCIILISIGAVFVGMGHAAVTHQPGFVFVWIGGALILFGLFAGEN